MCEEDPLYNSPKFVVCLDALALLRVVCVELTRPLALCVMQE